MWEDRVLRAWAVVRELSWWRNETKRKEVTEWLESEAAAGRIPSLFVGGERMFNLNAVKHTLLERAGREGIVVKRRCDSCLFWQRHDDSDETGFCFRYPPSGEDGDEGTGLSPATYNVDWCGEWQGNVSNG